MNSGQYAAEVTVDDFQRLVIEQSQQRPVLVDFWADWCAPCRTLMPLLAKLSDDYAGRFFLAKVDTEQQQALAARYQIRSLPTVKLFAGGQVVDEFMGALPETQLREFLERHIPRPSDEAMQAARKLFDDGDRETALQQASAAVAADPENPRLPLQLATLQYEAGDLESAAATLQGLPYDQRDSDAARRLQSRISLAGMAGGVSSLSDLEQRVAANPDDSALRYQLASAYASAEQYTEAMENFLQVVKTNRELHDDGARKALLQLFDVVDDAELVRQFRARLAATLY